MNGNSNQKSRGCYTNIRQMNKINLYSKKGYKNQGHYILIILIQEDNNYTHASHNIVKIYAANIDSIKGRNSSTVIFADF